MPGPRVQSENGSVASDAHRRSEPVYSGASRKGKKKRKDAASFCGLPPHPGAEPSASSGLATLFRASTFEQGPSPDAVVTSSKSNNDLGAGMSSQSTSMPYHTSEGDGPLPTSTLAACKTPELTLDRADTVPSQPGKHMAVSSACAALLSAAPPPQPPPAAAAPPKSSTDIDVTWQQYVRAELHINLTAPEKDGFFGETRRDKLYNSLFWVGPHLERYMSYGFLVCLDCFLAVLTLVPLRAACSLHSVLSGSSKGPHHLFHMILFAIWAASCATMVHIKAGAIYFWMKDITPEFLKIHALYGGLDILEKVLANFGIDTISSLAGTCNMLHAAPTPGKVVKRSWQLLLDVGVAWFVMTLHGVVIMCQAIIYAVALNGSKNALVALLIATQFMEVKGIVYKKFDEGKLFFMAQLDMMERFTLFVALVFVVCEDLVSSGTFRPDAGLLWECARIFMCEIVLDVLKHASLAKFNDIRPGIYREFFRSLTGEVEFSQSHNVSRAIAIEPFGMAALLVRQLVMLFRVKATALEAALVDMHGSAAPSVPAPEQLGLDAAVLWPVHWLGAPEGTERVLVQLGIMGTWTLGLWAVMLAGKLVLGFAVKQAAVRYNRYYDRNYKRLFKAKR